jgi:predicted Na+-dependent transporter
MPSKKTNTINMVIKPLMVRWFCGGGHGGMNMDDILVSLVIFSVVPLEAVADLEAVRSTSN